MMMISDEQVQQVAECLHDTGEYPACGATPDTECASSALMTSVHRVIELMPDVRADRVEAARELLATAFPDSDHVAAKLLGRVLSDSIR
jgi:hypothetical protein